MLLGNVVSLKPDSEVSINQINYYLPSSIQIIGKSEVPDDFKPRFADHRHYKYVFLNDPYEDSNMSLEKMREASAILKGCHNFQNFSKRCERVPMRTVKELTVTQKDGVTVIDVIGESFLWNMVRKMVKVITTAGNGEIGMGEVELLLDPEFQASITPVPPDGLILMDVEYSGVNFSYDGYAKNNFFKTIKEEYMRRRTIAAAEEVMISVLRGC